jgi:glycine hydroxymethyltransferase
LYTSLKEADPEVAKIVEDETWRQFSGLELIASEVRALRHFTSDES